MKRSPLVMVLSISTCVALSACGRGALPPGAVEAAAVPPPGLDTPEGVANFWSSNCAGCHGADGQLGAARPLDDPLWWRTMPDAQVVETVAVGLGRLMPGFSARAKGGPYIAYANLGDTEIELVVKGLRARWGTPGEPAAAGAAVRLGDAARGASVFANACASCHANGTAASVTDPMFLANITDQGLWSAVVFGRPDLGKAATTLPPGEVADVVAHLAAMRPAWASAAALDPAAPSKPATGDSTP